MKHAMTRRNTVRLISYTVALFFILAGIAWQSTAAARDYKQQLENTYTRSLGELSSYLTNISVDLDKGRYIGTSNQLSLMSARIWRESGSAKSALSALPVHELQLDNTYKFLSQAGDYAMVLSKKMASGIPLTNDDLENAKMLCDYAAKLRDYVDDVQQRVRDGQITVSAIRSSQPRYTHETGGTQVSTGLNKGFKDMEQTMTGYPTLIYDGPFSDHLLTRSPQMTKDMPAVTPTQAQAQAARAARVNPEDLQQQDDENSNMPSYTFAGSGINVGVTKAGGLVTYMINARDIGEQRLGRTAVFEQASQYLGMMGMTDLSPTYFETADGICTVNYAATQDDVILYTDLVKVGVALDDGSIVFYDARGYINNHKDRTLEPPALTVSEAAKSLNPSLQIQSNKLTLIPTAGQNEVMTYEFLTVAPDKERLLVYVNAVTGAEEQILLLVETPSGTLTK